MSQTTLEKAKSQFLETPLQFKTLFPKPPQALSFNQLVMFNNHNQSTINLQLDNKSFNQVTETNQFHSFNHQVHHMYNQLELQALLLETDHHSNQDIKFQDMLNQLAPTNFHSPQLNENLNMIFDENKFYIYHLFNLLLILL